jgi:hypothetical protein
MNRKITKSILLIVAAVFIANQYYSCKKLDIVREIMIKTLDATGVGISEATLRCELVDLGEGNITEFGCCYSISSNPTIIDNKAVAPGNPEIGVVGLPVSGLQPNTEYYYRAYALQGSPTGLVSYSGAVSFTTQDLGIETLEATNITENSATLQGEIIDLGGLDVSGYGFVYALTTDPTLADNKLDLGSNPEAGIYTSSLENLTLNTKYYFRAYAEVSEDNYASYGETKSFSTLENLDLPDVTTDPVFDITETSATCAGNVTSEGSAPVTLRGFCISLNQNPSIEDMCSNNGSGPGQFEHQFSGLSPDTIYYVRAYAQNSFGTAYGAQLIFYTSTGEWLHYDDGENNDGIGLNNGGDFDVAIRFEPNQLVNYDGWKITKFRFFPLNSFPTTYSIEIFTGPEGNELEYLQEVETVEPEEWNEVILETPYVIDASQPLYPGYWIQSQPIGAYPAGVDDGPAITGSGDLISLDAGQTWDALSIANPDLDFNWNLQVFATNENGEEQMLRAEPVTNPRKKNTNLSINEVSSRKQSSR